MVGADEAPAREPALLLGAKDRAAMAARVVEGAELAVEIPHDDDALGPDLDDLVVPRRGDLLLAPGHHPHAVPEDLELPLVVLGVVVVARGDARLELGERHPPHVIRGCLRPLHTSSLSVLRELPRPSPRRRGRQRGNPPYCTRPAPAFAPLARGPPPASPGAEPRAAGADPAGGVSSATEGGRARTTPRREDGWPCQSACRRTGRYPPARPSCIARRSCGTTMAASRTARPRR